LNQLKKDRFVRVTTGMLPEAVGAFGDEIFKASSATLNTLLKVLNERQYTEEGQSKPCPLRVFVGASNEWPQGEELGALYDRFLFRKAVKPVSSRSRERLLYGDIRPQPVKNRIQTEEMDQAREEASSIPFSPAAKETFRNILSQCQSEGVIPGDRRLRKCVKACQSSAWLAAETEVRDAHLAILKHCLWQEPSQAAKVGSIVTGLSAPSSAKLAEIQDEFLGVEEETQKGGVKDFKAMSATIAKLADLEKRAREQGDKGKELAKSIAEQIKEVKLKAVELV
jgi:MoxR-like ATPase